MATPLASNGTVPKKRKPQGPRVVKPRTLYIAVKGSVEEIRVYDTADEIMDLQDSEPGVFKVKRHVLPMKAKAGTPGAAGAAA